LAFSHDIECAAAEDSSNKIRMLKTVDGSIRNNFLIIQDSNVK